MLATWTNVLVQLTSEIGDVISKTRRRRAYERWPRGNKRWPTLSLADDVCQLLSQRSQLLTLLYTVTRKRKSKVISLYTCGPIGWHQSLPSTRHQLTLLPRLQVVIILGQPWPAYYKFPESEPWSAGGALLLRDRLCGTVLLLLYGDRRWHCTLSSDNSRPICSTSDVSTNRRNIHHCPAMLWHFRDSGAGYKTADLLTYLLTLRGHRYEAVALCCVPDYFPAFDGTHFAYPGWMARLSWCRWLIKYEDGDNVTWTCECLRKAQI